MRTTEEPNCLSSLQPFTQVTMENARDHKINKYFFLSVIVIFALFLLFSLIEFFTAFLAAVMFYVLSKPLVEWLIKKKFI